MPVVLVFGTGIDVTFSSDSQALFGCWVHLLSVLSKNVYCKNSIVRWWETKLVTELELLDSR